MKMWFLYLLTWLATAVQVCMVTLAMAAGLYYLAELVEEYTVISGRIIKYLHMVIAAVYIGLIVFEDLPLYVTVVGLISIAVYSLMLSNFPFIELTSPVFITSCVLVFVNHYLAFRYFSDTWHPFSEVLAYFTLCLWLVPFSFFVSLSANDNILPTLQQKQGQNKEDVVTSYFSKKASRSSLLSIFDFCRDSLLPQRTKRF